MKISKLYPALALVTAAMALASCNNRKFHIDGTITEATDSMLYLENLSLDGPVAIDSAKLDKDGHFAFEETAMDSVSPEFYRLRIANQTINLSIDSTETVNVKAAYPTMSYDYTVEGSDNCNTIKELALKQMNLQGLVNNIARNPRIGVDSANIAVYKAIEAYKNDVKRNYIFKAPMKASSYYALFQTILLGNGNNLIFNPATARTT